DDDEEVVGADVPDELVDPDVLDVLVGPPWPDEPLEPPVVVAPAVAPVVAAVSDAPSEAVSVPDPGHAAHSTAMNPLTPCRLTVPHSPRRWSRPSRARAHSPVSPNPAAAATTNSAGAVPRLAAPTGALVGAPGLWQPGTMKRALATSFCFAV